MVDHEFVEGMYTCDYTVLHINLRPLLTFSVKITS